MRLVLCDDNRIFCEALAVALEARGHQALAIATTADEGVAAVARHQPDACLLDFRFNEGGEGLGAARAIRDQYPDTAVLVVSGPGGQLAPLAAAQIGVAGFFGKDQELDKIAIALDTIAAGRVTSRPEPPGEDRLSALTPRETEVLRRIAAGQSTKTMAREMSVTTETLRTYVKNVLGKLGAHSRLEAAALAVPAVASAATPAAPPAAPLTQTIANQANASSQRNGHTDWVLKYQFKHVPSTATLNVTHNATATATKCRRCAGDGIAFQVVVTSAQNLANLNATNQANAVSSNCVRCSTFAGAYQIVYASNRKLAPWQIQSLNAVRSWRSSITARAR
jgi:DNA-binding NarL/FixJ family response regulator